MTVTTIFKTTRLRCEVHLAFVRKLPCLACGRTPSEAHHLMRGPEPTARGLKAGDNWAIPLCGGPGGCHAALHADGDEIGWSAARNINATWWAEYLWAKSVSIGRNPDEHKPKANTAQPKPSRPIKSRPFGKQCRAIPSRPLKGNKP